MKSVLPPGTRVQLRSLDPSPESLGRILRYTFAWNPQTNEYDVDLNGWLLRDSSLTSWFYLPEGTFLAPNDYRIVYSGVGQNGSPNPRDLYMGSITALFPNPEPGKFLGDGAYLLDRNTDMPTMRSYYEYPCVLDCSA